MINIAQRVTVALAAMHLFAAPVLAHPGSGIAVDRLGQVYFFDTGSGLWKIDTHGRLSRLSEKKYHWLALDANDRFTKARLPAGSDYGTEWEILRVQTSPNVLIASDWPIAVDWSGNICYQSGRPGGIRIMKTAPSGTSSVLADLPVSTSGGPLPHVNGLAPGPGGFLYYTENDAVRRISAQGTVTTVATVQPLANGPSIPGVSMDTRPLLRGLAVDSSGVMYVSAAGDGRLLRITKDGETTTLVQTETPWSPTAVALFGKDVYVLEYLNTARDVRRDWLPRVRRITSDGKSAIIATVDQMPGAR